MKPITESTYKLNDSSLGALRSAIGEVSSTLCTGFIHRGFLTCFRTQTEMTAGIIFSDGIEKDFLNFNSGSIATIGTAKETANLVMNKAL